MINRTKYEEGNLSVCSSEFNNDDVKGLPGKTK